MTDKDFDKLFKKRKAQSIYFDNWNCSKLEIELFTNWFNQLGEEEVCKYLKEDPTILLVISNQTDKMCETAVKTFPWSIKCLKNQTVDLCIYALDNVRYTWRYVRITPNPDYETTLKNLKEKKDILEALK